MSSQIIRAYEQAMLRDDLPDFQAGDTLRVSLKIIEGDKERLQDFEGVCIRRNNGGIRETITLRKVTYGVGMERIIPLHSPKLDKIKVVRRGKVRRAKLYYLRDLRGKAARIMERKTADGTPTSVAEAKARKEAQKQETLAAQAAAAQAAAAQAAAPEPEPAEQPAQQDNAIGTAEENQEQQAQQTADQPEAPAEASAEIAQPAETDEASEPENKKD